MTNKTTSYPLNSLSHVYARHRYKNEGKYRTWAILPVLIIIFDIMYI